MPTTSDTTPYVMNACAIGSAIVGGILSGKMSSEVCGNPLPGILLAGGISAYVYKLVQNTQTLDSDETDGYESQADE